MHANRLLLALVSVALLLAGCGDGDGAGEYEQALAESLSENEDVPFDQGQIDCLASEFVAAVGGPEALEDADITPDELRESDGIEELGLDPQSVDADALAASFGNCDISLAELILAEAGDQVPQDARDCITDALDEDVLSEFFAQAIIAGDESGDDLPPQLMEGLLECL